MTDIERRYWELAHFYKGYLPAKEDNEVNSYVVMVKSDPPEWGTAQEDFETINLSRFEHNESPFENMEDVFSDEKMLFREDTSPSKTDSFEVSSPFRRDAHRLLNPERSVSACNESIDSNGGVTYNQHMASQNKKEEVAFYMCRKNDVVPPPFKYTMTSKKVNRCFYMCFQKNCYCGRPHVKQDAWHVRLDHLNGTAIIVSDNGQNRKINREDIVPTAGYLFAVGIVAIGVVKTVIPVLCRFNQDCRNGSGCLYIHANVERCVVTQKVASTPLSEAVQYLEGMADGERELFLTFWPKTGLRR
ncbi:hypothetical protein AGDE_13705 [Angomonas deanei]|uniref:Uncharacterized protein n=1 Tax=Angomonas deanei TaxID=59799 RepID=A0A7G2C0J6_9TRYP|nr:hypothetical protein AGDE_13705 [Angomonas deanei]CAD2213209.1 hypothetical protein, conserved [Angomonas deanei]|eukprot:EPY21911.1 hypothetical protein AGDE_13705 [Angomonas deanei]